MKVVIVLELACENVDNLEDHPTCEGALFRKVGGQPEKADPLVVAMGRGHLIGEAKARGWHYVPTSRVNPTEMNLCPACWAEAGGKQ